MCVARATCDRAAKGPRKGLAAARPEMLKVTGCKLASCNTPFLRSCAPCSASAAPLAAACQSTAPPRHRLPLARPRGAAPSRRQPPRATAPRARAANSLRGWRSCARLPRAPWGCTPQAAQQLYHTPPAFPLAQTRHRHAQPRALVSPMPIYAKVISPIGAIANRANGCKASRSSLVATNTH